MHASQKVIAKTFTAAIAYVRAKERPLYAFLIVALLLLSSYSIVSSILGSQRKTVDYSKSYTEGISRTAAGISSFIDRYYTDQKEPWRFLGAHLLSGYIAPRSPPDYIAYGYYIKGEATHVQASPREYNYSVLDEKVHMSSWIAYRRDQTLNITERTMHLDNSTFPYQPPIGNKIDQSYLISSATPAIVMITDGPSAYVEIYNEPANANVYIAFSLSDGVVIRELRSSERLYDITKDGPLVDGWSLIWQVRAKNVRPVAIYFSGDVDYVTRYIWDDLSGNSSSYAIMFWKSPSMVPMAIMPLYGIRDMANKVTLWLEESISPDVIERIKFWQRLVFVIPMGSQEYFGVDANGVSVRNVFEYFEIPNKWTESRKWVPYPPLLSLALRGGYYVEFRTPYNYTGFASTSGPLYVALDVNLAEYIIPLPPLNIWHPFEVTPSPIEIPKNNRLLDEARTDVNPHDNRWSDAWIAIAAMRMYSFMNEEYRNLAHKLAYGKVLFLLDSVRWNYSTETTRKITYAYSYHLGDDKDGYRGDIDWGNSLSLTALYLYSTFETESYDVLAESWSTIDKIFNYYRVFYGWQIMGPSSREDSLITGSDTTPSAYTSILSYALLAKKLGNETAYREALYLSAKMAVLLNALVYPSTSQYYAESYHEDALNMSIISDTFGDAVSWSDAPRFVQELHRKLFPSLFNDFVAQLYRKYANNAYNFWFEILDKVSPKWYANITIPEKLGIPDDASYYLIIASILIGRSIIERPKSDTVLTWVSKSLSLQSLLTENPWWLKSVEPLMIAYTHMAFSDVRLFLLSHGRVEKCVYNSTNNSLIIVINSSQNTSVKISSTTEPTKVVAESQILRNGSDWVYDPNEETLTINTTAIYGDSSISVSIYYT